jgi:hypothetical protein
VFARDNGKLGPACLFVLVALFCCLMPSAASALAPGRVYEMVTPPFTGGYGVTLIKAAAPDGESMSFASVGAFGSAPTNTTFNGYLARRNPGGWSTVSIQPPAAIAPDAGVFGFPTDFSATLESSISLTRPGPNLGVAFTAEPNEFLLHPSDAPEDASGYYLAGLPLSQVELPGEPKPPFQGVAYLSASSDFSHLVFEAPAENPLLPLAVEAKQQSLYDLATNGTPLLRLVGVNDSGALIDPYCPVRLGSQAGRHSQFNAVSADGGSIFFTDNTDLAATSVSECDGAAAAEDPANPAMVFARLNGEKTFELSQPIESDCAVGAPCRSASPARAEFEGANETGTRAFFITAQPLVTGDTDSGRDVYMAQIGCPGGGKACTLGERQVTSLVQISGGAATGEAAEVQGVVRIAPDGSRVYFVARGVLTGEPNAQGASATRGADNLYVYDEASESVSFIAELPGETGLWESQGGEAQTAGRDGRYLVFSTYARLLPSDTNVTKDVYRYDAANGALDRVSIGEGGYDANGNERTSNASISFGSLQGFVSNVHGLAKRAISEDGSRVVFTTATPLSPAAINGLSNAYEWRETSGSSEGGAVSLVSSGNAEQPVVAEQIVIAATFRDIFFATGQGLVPQDKNDTTDIYDARLGGGFPPAPTEREPCSSDACQGPLSVPAAVLVPGSLSQPAGENLAPLHTHKARVKKRRSHKKKKRRRGKGSHVTGRRASTSGGKRG